MEHYHKNTIFAFKYVTSMAKKPFTPIPPMAELPEAEEIDVRELLDKYLSGEIDLICVLGPTASGKTRYAVRLARQINDLLQKRSLSIRENSENVPQSWSQEKEISPHRPHEGHQNEDRLLASASEKRATPLAAGGGARSEGVGGVVFNITPAVPDGEGSVNEVSKASSRINVTDNSALGLPRAEIRMACSKGTYVRAFARDLGEALGSGAHLDSLQRSRSGIFRIENALTVEQTVALLAN